MNNIEKLPDSYEKSETGNNYKLLKLNELSIELLQDDTDDVFSITDLEQANGATLDLYGKMLGQKRGQLTDEQYRILLLTKIGMNVGDGTYNKVLGIMQNMFNCRPDDIILNDGEDSCKVLVERFPFIVLIKAGFTSRQAVQMIQTLLPIGVSVDSADFEGTFEFSETYEYDENKGFGNIEQTIGGYFGLLFGEDDEREPIIPL